MEKYIKRSQVTAVAGVAFVAGILAFEGVLTISAIVFVIDGVPAFRGASMLFLAFLL